MNKPAARFSALSLSLMLLAGCATTSLTSTPDSPAQGQALALIEQGKPRDAAPVSYTHLTLPTKA